MANPTRKLPFDPAREDKGKCPPELTHDAESSHDRHKQVPGNTVLFPDSSSSRLPLLDRMNTDKRGLQFNLGEATPISVAINVLPIAVSSEELMTYFPRHVQWEGYLRRLYCGGWGPTSISEYVRYSRNLGSESRYGMMNVKKASSDLGLKARQLQNAAEDVKDLSPNNFTLKYKSEARYNYRLADLAQGVVHHPPAHGRGQLTECVLYAKKNADKEYTLYNVPELSKKMGFPELILPHNMHVDKQSCDRFVDMMEKARAPEHQSAPESSRAGPSQRTIMPKFH